MIGNVKNALTGTYHSVSKNHFSWYLAEFCYRFNRRFQLEYMIPRFVLLLLNKVSNQEQFYRLSTLTGC